MNEAQKAAKRMLDQIEKANLQEGDLDSDEQELCNDVTLMANFILRAEARREHGPKTLEAKWLDPKCWDGCKSLVWKDHLKYVLSYFAEQPAFGWDKGLIEAKKFTEEA